MFCNYCRALNPEDAIYCSNCGRTVQIRQGEQSTAKQKQTEGTLQPPQVAHRKRDPDDSPREELSSTPPRFLHAASGSASAVAIAPATEDDAPTDIVNAEVSERPTKGKVTAAPYAHFALQLFASCFSGAVGVFAGFEALARDTTAPAAIALSIVFTSVFAWSGRRTWRRITATEAKTDPKARRRIRNTIIASVVLVLLYLGVAALIGSVIGQNRAESIQFNTDVMRQKELARRITEARNSVTANIPSYVDTYTSLESDVTDYAATLSRLRAEVGTYDSKFPTQRQDTQRYRAVIETEIRRSELLAKQIAVAKRLALLDESSRWATWKSEMVPLLNAEDGLK